MTQLTYNVIEIFTSEQARWRGVPLYDAIVRVVARQKSAARCIVTRGVAGCFENGELASHRVLDLSHNMPLKIEIILPAPELAGVLSEVENMVQDGIVLVEESLIRIHRTGGGLLPRGLLVRDVMTSAPVSVTVDTELPAVISLLVRSEFDGVPVVDAHSRLVGMVTEDKVTEKVGLRARPRILASLSQGSSPEADRAKELLPPGSEALRARDVMDARLVTVRAEEALVDAVRRMVKEGIKRLPVVDDRQHLLGVLSRIDVLRVASAGQHRREVLKRYGASVPGSVPVSRALLLEVPTVSPGTGASEVMNLIDNPAERVVVLDEQGRLQGVISDRDVLPLLDPKRAAEMGRLTAASLMRKVSTIAQHATVDEALSWMVEHRRKYLPVVDEEGKYLGLLSRTELLRVLLPEAGQGGESADHRAGASA